MPLITKISDENFVYNLIEDPLYMMSCFSFVAFKSLSLSLHFSLIEMCLDVDFFICLEFVEFTWHLYTFLLSSLGSCQPLFLFFFSAIISLNISYVLFSLLLLGPLGPLDDHFSSVFFSFCSCDLIISFVLFSSLPVLSSTCSNWPLNSSSEF